MKKIRLAIKTVSDDLQSNKRASGKTKGNYNDGDWIEIWKIMPGMYEVLGDSLTKDREFLLGFSHWAPDVEHPDSDTHGDAWGCFKIAEHLKWSEVDLKTNIIHAPSVRILKQALARVTFCTWDPYET